ncbi:MAG: hypothetical protein LUC86_08975 [Prevotellaceae bacterium]|nr:hypothetical protein [Prevotellaceae bacterium]
MDTYNGEEHNRTVSRTQGLSSQMRLGDEEAGIVSRAKADGTYGKAPGGGESRLFGEYGEHVWAMVRAKAFKDWFGDWEKPFRIEKLRRSEPVEITGREYEGKYELSHGSARRWMYDNLHGDYVNSDTGDVITVEKSAAGKVPSHDERDKAHFQSIAAIPDLIRNAVFVDELPNKKGNGKFQSYRYYVCGLRIGGEDYTVKMVVGVKNGKKYYDHSLTGIEKGRLLDLIGGAAGAEGFKATADESPSYAPGKRKDTRLFDILQTNHSKMVDENGEPKVFYHNTDGSFTEFDPSRNGTHNDAGWLGDGFYFYGDEREGWGYGSKQMPVFLDVKNPYYATQEDNERLAEKNSREASVEFREQLESEGYDGVYYNGDLRQETVVFKPEQIKSVDNEGSFSRGTGGTRFRETDPDKVGEATDKAIAESARKLAKSLGAEVEIANSIEEVTDPEARRAIEQGRSISGWYDTETGRVVIYMPNVKGEADATRTVLHEVVGHRGLRGLIGEEPYDAMMRSLLEAMPKGKAKNALTAKAERMGWTAEVAMDEYLAEKAETAEKPTWWGSVVSTVRAALRAMGLGLDLTEADVNWMLYRSRRNLEGKSDLLGRATDIALRLRADRAWKEERRKADMETLEGVSGQKTPGRPAAAFGDDQRLPLGTTSGYSSGQPAAAPRGGLRFGTKSLGKRRRAEMLATLNKRRDDMTDGQKEALLNVVADTYERDGGAVAEAAFKWFTDGTVRLPEDMDKVRQAVQVAKKAGVDPASYKNPMDLINQHAEFRVTEERVNPDSVPTLSNKRELANGITVYDVAESEESRRNMRGIINTHWGRDCSPWCLLQGDKEGNLTEQSAGYWQHYGRYGKRVAFKDGRLLAFFAAGEDDEPTWWDRQDSPHRGIPVTRKMDDGSGRVATYEMDEKTGEFSNPTNIHKGNRQNGEYEEWYDDGKTPKERSRWEDGVEIRTDWWYENGQLNCRMIPGQGLWQWYSDGRPCEIQLGGFFDHGFSGYWSPEGEFTYLSGRYPDKKEVEAAYKSMLEEGKEKAPALGELRFREDDGEERRREEPWERDEGERRKLADYLMGNDYVAELTGQEFMDASGDLIQKVSDYYNDKFGGKVEREGYGDVALSKDGVRASLSHGRMTKRKAAAYMAVPYIIRDGREIDNQRDWKGRGYESATFAAPVKIGDDSYVGVVVVRKGENAPNFRFYLHKITAQKSLFHESSTTGSSPGWGELQERGIAKVLRDIIQPKENGIKITEEGEESSNDTVSDSAANAPEDVRRTDGNPLGEQAGTPPSDKPGSAGEGLGTTERNTKIPRIRGGERVADRIYRAIAGRLGVSEAEGRSESPGRPAANRHNAQRLTSRAGSGYLSRRLLSRGRNAST